MGKALAHEAPTADQCTYMYTQDFVNTKAIFCFTNVFSINACMDICGTMYGVLLHYSSNKRKSSNGAKQWCYY